MNSSIITEEVSLVEKSKADFSKKVEIKYFTNSERLEHLQVKYLFIQQGDKYLGYVVLTETKNKITNGKYWILLNFAVAPRYRGLGIASAALKEIHRIFSSELDVKSYMVTLNSFIMYKMIVRENLNGVINFYCLINNEYSVEEMKEEEQNLEEIFLRNPSTYADMIVSLDEEETARIKPIYFKVKST